MTGMIADFQQLMARVPDEPAAVLERVSEELTQFGAEYSRRQLEQRKIRDQWRGAPWATQSCYHPDQYGLNEDQQAHFRRILERSHVNLVEPALDRLVNSIHAGKIRRRVAEALPELQMALDDPRHASAMARLCENAFAYGTAALVPLPSGRGVRYWLPDPLNTYLATDPADVEQVTGVVELIRNTINLVVGVRYVTREHRGWALLDGSGGAEDEEHGLSFLPAVVAYGRDQRHLGERYGRSLVLGVADASIRITNNEVNLELLRDRQTQALLVVQGEPTRTSADDGEAQGKYVAFPRDGGDARYETPESRLEAVIELTKRFAADAAVSSGLPLDTFLPELIAGSDASATAARIRAFPLQQRMVRLVQDWQLVELDCIEVLAAVMAVQAGTYAGETREEVRLLTAGAVKVLPSMPEAEAETLAGWAQKTTSFMAPITDAIEYYSDHLTEEEKAELARAWALKNDPTVQNGASDELAKFKREIAKALYSGATTKEVMANLTDLRALVDAVGLPREADYVEPFLPVVAPTGPLVTGEVVKDEAGDVVGGAVQGEGTQGTQGT